MTLYTATFSVAHLSAAETFEADTPELALQFAQETFATDPVSIDWHSYDPDISELEEITITDFDDNLHATWQSDNLRLRLAAPDLLDALEALVERDRAAAAECGFTDDEMSWLEDARRAIAKAKGGVP